MSVFWFLVAAMSALALVFIVPPALRARSTQTLDHDLITTEVIKQQLAELDADLETGKLDQAAYTAARHDLERTLLDDLGTSANTHSGQRSGRWLGGVLALAVPAAALWLYHQLGTQAAISVDTPSVAAASDAGKGHSLETMINRLASRLREKPDDIEGWIMLATSYASTNRFDRAVDAYREALQRTGDHPQLLADYADTLAMASGGDFTAEVGDALQRALKLQPENIKALWLMGHWHYQRNQYDAALKLWEKAASLLPPGGQDAVALTQQITLARARLGIPAVESITPVKEQTDASDKTGIQVTVTLDASLKDKAAPQDTLFIFARAVKGPRMPLAIVRKQVSDLPVTVTLDDSLAMSPQMVLSNFDEVSIGARISRTGNAMPSSGDLKGEQGPVSVSQDSQVTITINNVIP